MKKLILFGALAALIGIIALRSPASPGVRGTPGPEDSQQIVEKFHLEGFSRDGQGMWDLRGEVASVTPDLNVFIQKNVRLTLRKKTIVKADKVLWRNADAKFVTNRPVNVVHEGHRITGVGAVGMPHDEFLQLNRDIRMELQGPILVECAGPFKIYRGQNRAIFLRNVKIRDSKGTLECQRLDAHFDKDAGKIRQLIAYKDVVIRRGSNVSHSDKAIYDTVTQSIRLVGSPKIQMQKNDLPDLKKEL